MLWALLLWDAIFCPQPDVFRSRLQTSPLDLDTDAFFPARQVRAGRATAAPVGPLAFLAQLPLFSTRCADPAAVCCRLPQEIIEARLAEVAAGRAPELLTEAWHAHHGTMCRGVTWDRWPLDQLTTVVQCVGGAGLAAVCRLLSQDHAGWTGEPRPAAPRAQACMHCRAG